jgi:hypothetical protein
MVESFTGTRAETCPWYAFTLPLVIDTISAYTFFESGQLAMAIGADPPNILVEAIECYHNALNRVRAKQDRQKADQRAHDAQHAAAVREMSGRG